IDPNQNVTFYIYKDADHEMRVYRGWSGSGSSGSTTGPIEVTRQYRDGTPDTGTATGRVYIETLTSSATPTASGGVPTGQESITSGNIQSLSRSITNIAGQIVETDAYFNLSGLTYS